jgi:hypothetical protein
MLYSKKNLGKVKEITIFFSCPEELSSAMKD